jgi:hypothetical protein
VIYGQIKKLIRVNTKELENYAGDSVLVSEEKLKKGDRLIFSMIKMCTRLTARHDLANEKSKKSAVMMQYYKFETVSKKLCEQYRNRTTGENGLAGNLIMLNNGLEIWQQRLELASQAHDLTNKSKSEKLKLSESDWVMLYQSLDEWTEFLKKASLAVGNQLKDLDELNPKNVNNPDV